MQKESKLFIEQNKKTNEFQILITVGKFKTKEDAAQHASFIALTKSFDFSPAKLFTNLIELEEEFYQAPTSINRTLH